MVTLWASAEQPQQVFNIVCHVLLQCTYDVILGNQLLLATETMTKYRRRLTESVFYVAKVFLPYALRFNFVGGSRQFLEGTLAGEQTALAVPDTDAKGKIMDLRYVPFWCH